MVKAIRHAETMLGNPEKAVGAQESAGVSRYHRKLAARHDLTIGHKLGEQDISFLRMPPDVDGLASDTYWAVIGRKLKRPVACRRAFGRRRSRIDGHLHHNGNRGRRAQCPAGDPPAEGEQSGISCA